VNLAPRLLEKKNINLADSDNLFEYEIIDAIYEILISFLFLSKSIGDILFY